jgi:ankyrin repeat protein
MISDGGALFIILYIFSVPLAIAGGVLLFLSFFGKKRTLGKVLRRTGIVLLIPFLLLQWLMISDDLRHWRTLTPMQRAIEKNRYNKVQQLITAGHNVNEERLNYLPLTPLNCAIVKGNLRMVRLLVENGADVNFKASINQTLEIPLSRAIFGGDTAIVNYLLARGADVSSDDGSAYPIQYAIRSFAPNKIAIIEALIKYGADVNVKNGAPLQEALRQDDNYELVRFLLEHGAK